MYKKYYKTFIDANPGLIHMASHSHHFWPDIAIKAQGQFLTDTINMIDEKWNYALTKIAPKSQSLISQMINFDRPQDISFASNTHELVARLISAIDKKDFKILTTVDEFHSAGRQFRRLNEEDNITVEFIDIKTENGKKDFLSKINGSDLIFLSHVFFNSGLIVDWDFIKECADKKSNNQIMCIDGYHSFCAIPVDISSVSDKVFFLAGGYKYAQAGEGMCFMTLPKDCKLRPKNTGWFASFEELGSENLEVHYSDNGFRFAGATRDISCHYRFNATWDLFNNEQLSVNTFTKYVKDLQKEFIKNLPSKYTLLEADTSKIGRFLTIKFDSESAAESLYKKLRASNVMCDFRGKGLRFGFAPYIDNSDIKTVIKLLGTL